MISNAASDFKDADHIVVITAGASDDTLVATLDAAHPDWSIAACDTYMAGIVEVARRNPRAVLAHVDHATPHVYDAVAALREAAGKKAKLVLCCNPEHEPVAQRAAASGADDYVLCPLDAREFDTAIGITPIPAPQRQRLSADPVASMSELAQVGSMVSLIGARPMDLVEKLAALVLSAIPTRGVTVVVEGAVASAGTAVTKPVLSAPLKDGEDVIGQISVGEPLDQPYIPADFDKLMHYTDLASRILSAAAAQRHFRRLAFTDECSGLPNRRHLNQQLDSILEDAAARRFPVTLLLFDVDDFKRYNDDFGHDAGDRVLRLVGELFIEQSRDQDVVTRYGGDEFAVVFWDPEGPRVPGSKHPECAFSVLERVREALKQRSVMEAAPPCDGEVTISGGLATYPWDAANREELIKRADEALLTAKRAGKNRVFAIGQPDTGE